MEWLAWIAALAALAGMVQALAGWAGLRHFRRAMAEPAPAELPSITVLKPLHGDEPLLEPALASLCAQEYPRFQVVCGVQRADDPAIAVVDRLRARFPAVDLVLVMDATAHGANRKVGNLLNMLPEARHDVLVIADSDVWCAGRGPGHHALCGPPRLRRARRPARHRLAQPCLPARRRARPRAGAAGLPGRHHGAAPRDAGTRRRARGPGRRDRRRPSAGPQRPRARAGGGAGPRDRRHDGAGGDAGRAVPPRAALGPHHPRAGTGGLRPVRPAAPAGLGAGGRGAVGRRGLGLGAACRRLGLPGARGRRHRPRTRPCRGNACNAAADLAFAAARPHVHRRPAREPRRHPRRMARPGPRHGPYGTALP